MSAVFAVNLVIHKGTDFETEFNLTEDNGMPLDLTGYTGSAKIRKHPTAKKYNTFVVNFVDRLQGKVKISMGSSITPNLSPGRNCYDLFLTDRTGKIIKVVEGNVLVNNSVTLGGTSSENIDGLGNIDVSNVSDGYVLMYDQSLQKYVFVDPDEVLTKAVTIDNRLPEVFVNKLDQDLDDRIDLDGGSFSP
jgi:hypothetical protein